MKVPARPSLPVKRIWAIAGGTIALLALAIGMTFWLGLPTPDADLILPARRGAAELGKPANLHPAGASRRLVRLLVPGLHLSRG